MLQYQLLNHGALSPGEQYLVRTSPRLGSGSLQLPSLLKVQHLLQLFVFQLEIISRNSTNNMKKTNKMMNYLSLITQLKDGKVC